MDCNKTVDFYATWRKMCDEYSSLLPYRLGDCEPSGCPLADNKNPKGMYCYLLPTYHLPELINRLQKWADERGE